MKLTSEQNQEIKEQQSQENKTKRVTAPELEDIPVSYTHLRAHET